MAIPAVAAHRAIRASRRPPWGNPSVDTAKVLAFTSLSIVPALVFFSLFQRRIVGGLTGAVKG